MHKNREPALPGRFPRGILCNPLYHGVARQAKPVTTPGPSARPTAAVTHDASVADDDNLIRLPDWFDDIDMARISRAIRPHRLVNRCITIDDAYPLFDLINEIACKRPGIAGIILPVPDYVELIP